MRLPKWQMHLKQKNLEGKLDEENNYKSNHEKNNKIGFIKAIHLQSFSCFSRKKKGILDDNEILTMSIHWASVGN